MRAGARAEEEKVAAARARTAATQAFNRLPFHTRRQLGGVPPPTTEALREAILQRTRVPAIPPPQPALAPPALTPPTAAAPAPVATLASAPPAAGAPVAAVVGGGRPASAVVTESQAQLRPACPAAAKERTASATVGQHLPHQRLGPPGASQPEAAPARLEISTALLPVSAVVGSQRHTVRFMPRTPTDQAAAAAVGASPFIELVNLKCASQPENPLVHSFQPHIALLGDMAVVRVFWAPLLACRSGRLLRNT